MEPDRALAKSSDEKHRVRAEQHCASFFLEAHHAIHALLLERAVANRQRFVHHQHLGVYIGGNRERQAGRHPRRVGAQRLIHELSKFRKRHNVLETVRHCGLGHAQQRPVELRVLPPCELGVDPHPKFENRRNRLVGPNRPRVGGRDPRDRAEEGRLAGAVLANDAYRFPGVRVEADVFEDRSRANRARAPEQGEQAVASAQEQRVPSGHATNLDTGSEIPPNPAIPLAAATRHVPRLP